MLGAGEESFICINNCFQSLTLVNLYLHYILNKSEEMLLNVCGTETKLTG